MNVDGSKANYRITYQFFQYDPEMLEALDLAIRALIIQSTFECDEREDGEAAYENRTFTN